ncbi:SapC family protein [uncultured Gilvimarinus sp.]|uniref:SapC family protein n=1 Tax=uncultured Gilvimarinus sp. TaxID=1689143 RepID=UPI0030D74929
MAKYELLNNTSHKDLKVDTQLKSDYGDNVHAVPTYLTEFEDVQREYPILFRHDSDDFEAFVVFGFQREENLFLTQAGWSAKYVPAVVARGPFLIGYQRGENGGPEEPMIHVDMDSPRLSEAEGQPVFLEHGGNTPYIDRVSRQLLAIHEGIELNKAMFSAFSALDLIEPVVMDVEIPGQQPFRLQGYYTIHEEKLANLKEADLVALHRAGFLRAAYLVLSSLGNLSRMVEMKKARMLDE